MLDKPLRGCIEDFMAIVNLATFTKILFMDGCQKLLYSYGCKEGLRFIDTIILLNKLDYTLNLI